MMLKREEDSMSTGTMIKQKVTKVRRQRQARNPQLSVARRNERERNRVKLVNNGFAKLRDHLPVEYLQQTSAEEQQSDAGTPDLSSNKSCSRSNNNNSSQSKKFSKVETLRAAIQHIRMLEQLMRSVEPDFDSINIMGAQSHLDSIDEEQQQQPGVAGSQLDFAQNQKQCAYAFDEFDAPLSVCEPLSCASSSSLTTSSVQSASQQQQMQQQQHQLQHHNIYPTNERLNRANFIKLEPQQQQRRQAELAEEQSHTHLWIQQHQNSFEQQSQQWFGCSPDSSPNSNNTQLVQLQQQQHSPAGSEQQVWFASQQQQQSFQQFNQQQQQHDFQYHQRQHHFQQHHQHQLQMQQQFAQQQQQHRQQHQISLYSQ